MESAKELAAAARAQTGLDSFGSESFREGLEVLVDALNRESRLNDAGEYAIRDRILMHLRQRLQIEDWYRRHPEIDDGEIRAPLFGVSLPRTGSSALSFLLASDPAIRYLRVWESSQPAPPPATVEGPDPRRGKPANAADELNGPGQHTPTGIDGAMECQDLMALDFKSQMFLAFAKMPSYARWVIDADLTETYLYEKRVLKLLQWREPARPWRLKAPSHMLWMPALDNAFPDARFVMTHRDPTDVILSVCTVYADMHGHFSDHVDHGYIGELNVEQWSKGMERTIAFREAGNDDRFFDIHFRAMQQDPLGQVRALYAWLGEEVSPVFAGKMAEWWAENDKRERSAKPDPELFGLDFDVVRGRFSDYLAHIERWAPLSHAA
ncbi:sulfotransferase family protein [Novosphingobium sp. PC22D]|uniref:sulfotransferase family protein n=1 Tax=Novosphingobium sp. PC22D TaxID=1962403 RepID=UPI000BF20583|nr:sulfotransferase [Novosphingobium sp. PC22D]PEQ12734.1 sulfotransferase family protein [Novosphingobium sp. PC22D]